MGGFGDQKIEGNIRESETPAQTFALISFGQFEYFFFSGCVYQQSQRLLITKMIENHEGVEPNLPFGETFDFVS